MWNKIGGVIGIITILGLVIAILQLVQSSNASQEQDIAQATQISILEQQLDVNREMVTLQASVINPDSAATSVATRVAELEGTAIALVTMQAYAPVDTSSKSVASEKDGMTLIYISAGEFKMGSLVNSDEQPIHSVFLSAFWIDQTEVTNKQYSMCVSAGACSPPSQIKSQTRNIYYGDSAFDNYPVIYVTWENANDYCNWAGRNLPTEAQWEKAASWNNSTQESYVYPWGNNFNGSIVNFCDSNCTINHADNNSNDGYADTSPVMNYPSGVSPYGVYDMAGNVWEWVSDWYDDTYYSYSPSSDPLGANSGTYRTLRGDSWWGYSYGVRSADRNPFVPSKSANNIGFRCTSSNP
jgi:formylglycine-generating enzyme required for sulfatase activity